MITLVSLGAGVFANAVFSCFIELDLNTPIVRGAVQGVALHTALAGLLLLCATRLPVRQALSRLTLAMADFVALLAIMGAVPTVFTIATYYIAMLQLPLVDEHLAKFELMLGLPHLAAYRWVHEYHLESLFQALYDSIHLQLVIALAYFFLVKGNSTRMWEYAAVFSVACVSGLVAWCVFQAEGPHTFYEYTTPPPPFLPVFQNLRSGTAQVMNTGYGMVAFPSFHTVFAVLLARLYRGERWVYPVAVIVNVGVVIATFPMGWHYLVDLLGGAIWTLLAIAVTNWYIHRKCPAEY